MWYRDIPTPVCVFALLDIRSRRRLQYALYLLTEYCTVVRYINRLFVILRSSVTCIARLTVVPHERSKCVVYIPSCMYNIYRQSIELDQPNHDEPRRETGGRRRTRRIGCGSRGERGTTLTQGTRPRTERTVQPCVRAARSRCSRSHRAGRAADAAR